MIQNEERGRKAAVESIANEHIIEQIKATSAKFKALFERMDAQILVLDDIIAQLEEENGSNRSIKRTAKKINALITNPYPT